MPTNETQVIEPHADGDTFMPEDIVALVTNHPLLAGLPANMTDFVAGCARNVAVRPGEFLLIEGEAAETLYLLRRGRVSLEIRTPGREPLVIETLGPGMGLGWSWMFPPYRWQFDARALEPVGAIALDAPCIRSKAEADPAFGYALMRRVGTVIMGRLDAAQARLLELYGRDRAERRR